MLIFEVLSEQNQMTEVEQNIANYFLNVGHDLKEKSSRTIAGELYVSPSTVSRFCQSIGYTGFNTFKESYLKDLAYLDSNFHDINPNLPFSRKDKNQALAHKMASLYKETVDDTLGLIQHDSLQQATRHLLDASLIVITAAGDLLEMAESFKNRMLKIGKNVIVEKRLDNAFYQASYAKKGTCFILLSYSGEVEGLLKVAHVLRERHFPMIAVTSYGDNKLSALATVTIHVSTREKLVDNLGNFSSLVSVSFLLDVLYSNVFTENFDHNKNNRRDVSHAFEQKRKSQNPLIDDFEN